MPTREEWITIIKGRGGRIGGGAVTAEYLKTWELIDGDWHYYSERSNAEELKSMRDKTAREMRKDGWEVETKTWTTGYYLSARRRRRET